MIVTPTQSDLDRFAHISGDANPIHVDPVFAGQSGFGRTVAHGAMLTAWLVTAACPDAPPTSTSAMFPAPAFANEPLLICHDSSTWWLERVSDGTCVCRLMTCAPVPELEAEQITTPPLLPLAIGMKATFQRRIEAYDLDDRFAGQAFVLGMISTLLGMTLPGQGTNYLKQETQWLDKIDDSEIICASVTITRLRPEKRLVDLATFAMKENGDIVARGRALVSARDVIGAF